MKRFGLILGALAAIMVGSIWFGQVGASAASKPNSTAYAANDCNSDLPVVDKRSLYTDVNCLHLSSDPSTYKIYPAAASSGDCPARTVDAAGPQAGILVQAGSSNECVYFINGAFTIGPLPQSPTTTSTTAGCPKLGTPGLNIDCSNGKNPIYALLQFAINWLSGILVAYIVYVIVRYGAIGYITAQGNPEGIKEAKTRLSNAVIGLILLSLMFVILRAIGI